MILNRGLNRQIKYINDVFFPAVLSLAPIYQRDADDNVNSETARLAAEFDRIADEMVDDINTLHVLQADDHSGQWINLVKSELGIDLSAIITRAELGPALDLFSEGTANLIKGVSSDLAKGISRQTVEALKQGMSARELAKDLSLRYTEELHGSHVGRTEESRKRNMARKRAAIRRQVDPTKGTGLPYRYQSRYQLIARDQTAKLTAYLDRLRQEQAGIEKYRWLTSRDERVRDRHKQYEGQTYRWDKPPSDGHPGEAVQCRCLAIAVVE